MDVGKVGGGGGGVGGIFFAVFCESGEWEGEEEGEEEGEGGAEELHDGGEVKVGQVDGRGRGVNPTSGCGVEGSFMWPRGGRQKGKPVCISGAEVLRFRSRTRTWMWV